MTGKPFGANVGVTVHLYHISYMSSVMTVHVICKFLKK